MISDNFKLALICVYLLIMVLIYDTYKNRHILMSMLNARKACITSNDCQNERELSLVDLSSDDLEEYYVITSSIHKTLRIELETFFNESGKYDFNGFFYKTMYTLL